LFVDTHGFQKCVGEEESDKFVELSGGSQCLLSVNFQKIFSCILLESCMVLQGHCTWWPALITMCFVDQTEADLTLGQRSNMSTFPDSLGMTFYTLAILFFALKPI
jgi:hypothetical protein